MAGTGSEPVSVVIPAHNERAVITRCLSALTRTAQPLDVVVVCNGCTDGTAEVAAAFGRGVRVISIPEPSKIAALNRGDEEAVGFPRFFVDADIQLDGDDLMVIAERLRREEALLAAPGLAYDTSRSTWAVRAYYRIWTRLPSVRDDVVGRGVYGVSRQGRNAFARFPDVVADDHWIRDHFEPHDRTVVPEVTSVVDAPRTLRGLLARKVRVYSSLAALDRTSPVGRLRARGRQRQWVGIVRDDPSLLAALPVYLFVSIAPRVVAAWRKRRGVVGTWERDETTRATHSS